MVTTQAVKLCRICLKDGAACPIFEDVESEKSVYSKLFQCFKQEIEDIKGYPNNICLECFDTLSKLCDFIQTFKESHKILEGGLLHLKQEGDDGSTEIESDNDFTEVEVELKTIKSDPEILFGTLENTDQLVEFLEPLPVIKENYIIKNESLDKPEKERIKKVSNKYNFKTNKIADSILEGEFTWTGERWCLKSTQLKVPKEDRLKGKRRNTRLKLPRKAVIIHSKLCDICGDVFKTQHKLNVHRKKIHFKNPVQCPQCPRMYSSEYNLNRHIKRKHERREFMCASCGNSFAFKSELSCHIKRVHTMDKTKKIYSCKYCDKQYKCAKSVLVHERSVHTGERPAECSICSKSFYHIEYLREHMRLHTGEAPFKCPICGRGYAQRCNMKSHLRIHRISEIDSAILSKMKPNYVKLLKV